MNGSDTDSNISNTQSCKNSVNFTSIQTSTTCYISNQTQVGLPRVKVIGCALVSKVLPERMAGRGEGQLGVAKIDGQ